MKKKLEVAGWWWKPDQADCKIPGIAKIRQGRGAHVETLEAFPRNGIDPDFDIPVILGENVEHQFVSLLDSYDWCVMGMAAAPQRPYSSSNIKSRVAILGAHVARPDFLIHSLTTDFTNLNEWANVDRNVDHDWKPEKHYIATVPSQPPDPIVSEIREGLRVGLKFINWPVYTPRISYGVKSRAYFSVEFANGGSIEEHFQIIDDLQNLLTLFISRPIYVKGIQGTIHDAEDLIALPYRDDSRRSIDVYRISGYRQKRKGMQKFYPSRMLVALSDICDDLPDILRNWVGTARKYDLAYHLYFGVAFNKVTFIESKFLTYIQALEGYHRRLQDDGKYMSKAAYKKAVAGLLKAMPADLPSDLADSVSNAIRRANDLSLRTRLRMLLERRGENFLKTFFGEPEQCEEFIRRVVGTRDYLSHILDAGEVKMFDIHSDEFVPALERLQVLVEASLLEITGLSQEKIDSILMGRYDRSAIRYQRRGVERQDDSQSPLTQSD